MIKKCDVRGIGQILTLIFFSLQDHEFIPTRMKTINASKPAANPQQFTRVTSNPLLLSAQQQMLKVEEIKKAKEIVQVGLHGDICCQGYKSCID